MLQYHEKSKDADAVCIELVPKLEAFVTASTQVAILLTVTAHEYLRCDSQADHVKDNRKHSWNHDCHRSRVEVALLPFHSISSSVGRKLVV